MQRVAGSQVCRGFLVLGSLLKALVHGPSVFGDMSISLTPFSPSNLSPPSPTFHPHQAPKELEKSLPWWLHLQEGVWVWEGQGGGMWENSS